MRISTLFSLLALLATSFAAPLPGASDPTPSSDCDAPGNIDIQTPPRSLPPSHPPNLLVSRGLELAGDAHVINPLPSAITSKLSGRDNVLDVGTNHVGNVGAISEDCATCDQASEPDDSSNAPVKVTVANTGNAQIGDENTIKNLKSSAAPEGSNSPSTPSTPFGTVSGAPQVNAPGSNGNTGPSIIIPGSGTDKTEVDVLPLTSSSGSNGIVDVTKTGSTSSSSPATDVHLIKTPGDDAGIVSAENDSSKSGTTSAKVELPEVQQVTGDTKALPSTPAGSAPAVPALSSGNNPFSGLGKLLLNKPAGPSTSAHVPIANFVPVNAVAGVLSASASSSPSSSPVGFSSAPPSSPASSSTALTPSASASASPSHSPSASSPRSASPPPSHSPSTPISPAPSASVSPSAFPSPSAASSPSAPSSSGPAAQPHGQAQASTQAQNYASTLSSSAPSASSPSLPVSPSNVVGGFIKGALNLAHVVPRPSGSISAPISIPSTPTTVPSNTIPTDNVATPVQLPFDQIPANAMACDSPATHSGTDIVDICMDDGVLGGTTSSTTQENGWEACPPEYQHDVTVQADTTKSGLTNGTVKKIVRVCTYVGAA